MASHPQNDNQIASISIAAARPRVDSGVDLVAPAEPRKALFVLLQLTEELTRDLPLEESLKSVTRATIDLLGADHVSIRLLDSRRTALLSGARSGSGEDDRPMNFTRGEGVLGWVAERGEPVCISDVRNDSRYINPDAQSFPIRSLLAEPLWSSGEVIGVISATSPTIGAFNSESQLLLRLLANCSSPPIEKARLRRLAMFDDLTQAFNHRYLYPRLTEEIARAKRNPGDVSMLLLDLDHFKRVNDLYGHAAGDAVLRHFADRVRACVRRIDIFIRRGGEEFVLIMPQTGVSQAEQTATRILEAVNAERFPIDDSGVAIAQTVSIGVASWDGFETAEQIEGRADRAMYEAKATGRDRVVVSRPNSIAPRRT